MTINIKSLQGRILNIAHEKKVDFQLLINRLAAEQFLYRLSQSPYARKFIFKGGSLLTYLIDSDRKTKDLDFSIKEISNQVNDVIKIIQSVLEIPVDDGLEWKKVEGKALLHPETIFAEKLHISVKKRGQNTRMKDYYDLLSLIDYGLDKKKLKTSIQDVFTNRAMSSITQIQFEESESQRLQVYWEHF